MKKLTLVFLALAFSALAQTRVNKTFTVGANPINVATGLTTAATDTDHRYAQRVFIQMLPAAGAGVGYVMDGVRIGRVPSSSASIDLTAVLQASSGATTPGGTYSDSDPRGAKIDLARVWISGAHAGDTMVVSYVLDD